MWSPALRGLPSFGDAGQGAAEASTQALPASILVHLPPAAPPPPFPDRIKDLEGGVSQEGEVPLG